MRGSIRAGRRLLVLAIAVYFNLLTVGVPAMAAGLGKQDVLKFYDTQGEVFTEQRLRGQRVFLDVWAIWCAPCLENLPRVEALSREFAMSRHARVVSVHHGADYGRFQSVADFLNKNHYNFNVVLDPSGVIAKRYNQIPGFISVPKYILLDENGRIVRRYQSLDAKVLVEVRRYLQDVP